MKKVREEVKDYFSSGYFRQTLERSNPQTLSPEAIEYILDSVMNYRRF